jgi:hypothetical protein
MDFAAQEKKIATDCVQTNYSRGDSALAARVSSGSSLSFPKGNFDFVLRDNNSILLKNFPAPSNLEAGEMQMAGGMCLAARILPGCEARKPEPLVEPE